MKMIRLRLFSILHLLVLIVNVSLVLAEPPITSKILFTSVRDGNREIYIMNPDGSEQVNLTRHRADDLHAVWSPTGEQILFVSNRGGGVRDLYLMNPDGTNVRRVFNRQQEAYRYTPTWAPNGEKIAYVRVNRAAFTRTLYITTLGEEKEEFITAASAPAWSPDGTEIATIVAGRITFINVRTRDIEQLLPKGAMFLQRAPSWSIGGNKLVFSWNNNPLPPDFKAGIDPIPIAWSRKQTIYSVNRDGTDLQQLVDEAGPKAEDPELSPSGDEVLYTQEIKGSLQIFKLDISSGVRTQLTHIGGIFQANSGGDWFDPAYALPVSPQPELLTTLWGKLKQK